MKVRLMTSSMELVATGTVPPFNQYPDVLIWGTRLFTFHHEDTGVGVYREAFAFYLMDVDKIGAGNDK